MDQNLSTESVKLVFVGHVDHGKSTLIGRLLVDTDSLPDGKLDEIRAASEAEGRDLEFDYIMDHLREERQRGVTIDTAQTFFSSPTRDYVIIDAPGHKQFIKNMVTGASQAEGAILLCSVAEGVQEQTRRHAYVLKLLGLRQFIVAYNKMDMAGYEEARFLDVRRDLEEFLGRLGISPARNVPMSARRGDNIAGASGNMPWYEGPTLLEALDEFRKVPSPVEKPLRFPIQDVYTVDGKRVAVGRIESGSLSAGDRLCLLPEGKLRTVERILKFGEEDVRMASAGECIGVLFDQTDQERGEVGAPPSAMPKTSDSFHASVFWLSPEPLRPGQELTVRCSTQQSNCRIAEIRERIDSSTLDHLDATAGTLEETEVGEVTIRTDRPMVLETFYDVQELGRFVLVRGRDEVAAGGIVTAVEASP